MAGADSKVKRCRKVIHQAVDISTQIDKRACCIAVALLARAVEGRRALVGGGKLLLPRLLLLLAFFALFRRLLLPNAQARSHVRISSVQVDGGNEVTGTCLGAFDLFNRAIR
jgi:hypothetical protein